MKRFYVVLCCFLMLVLSACGAYTASADSDTKKSIKFECSEGTDPGTFYDISMNASDNSCHVIELRGSSAPDVKFEPEEYDITLTNTEYMRIQYLVTTCMSDSTEGLIYNTTSSSIARAISYLKKGDNESASKYLNEYYEESLKRAREYLEGK